MDLNQKIKAICKAKGFNKKELCEELGLNYIVFIRNIKSNLVTSDFLHSLKKRFPDVDLNWVFNEDDNYQEESDKVLDFELTDNSKLEKAIQLLNEIKSNLPLK